ncbi:MAG: hypothetical protein FWF81_10560 [Defluviitaleaceae bacterium]|nr:hypothetical protein [Defluviitaleaceae bacterium]
MKKACMLAILIVAFCGLTVFAYGDSVGETIGYVREIDGDVVHIVGEPLTENGFPDVFVKIGSAPIYDLLTGFRVYAEDILNDMDIRMAYRVQKTEPFHAMVVWLNWDDDDAAVFTVTVSDNINNNADGVAFLCANSRYRVELTHDTLIIDPLYGEISPKDIFAGMELFIWVDMITASTPALVYPNKVVVVV